MNSQRNLVSRRVDRILRVRRIGGALLIVGWAVVSLGAAAIFMTVRYTPEQLADVFRTRPGTQNLFLFLPAPEHYRFVGIALLIVGATIVLVGAVVRGDQQ